MKKLKGFTLAETLVTLSIIGVLAVLTLTTLGNKIDRNKALFKKAYSITERTVVELVNDETLYPYNYEKFGFKEDSNVLIVGLRICTRGGTPPPCNGTQNLLRKFCTLFSNNLSLDGNVRYEGSGTSSVTCNFATTDGIAWSIGRRTDDNGFLIRVDTNGDKGPNMPAEFANIGNDHATRNRDRFYMQVRDDGKMEMPENDETALSFLRSTNFNDAQNQD